MCALGSSAGNSQAQGQRLSTPKTAILTFLSFFSYYFLNFKYLFLEAFQLCSTFGFEHYILGVEN